MDYEYYEARAPSRGMSAALHRALDKGAVTLLYTTGMESAHDAQNAAGELPGSASQTDGTKYDRSSPLVQTRGELL